MNQASSQLPQDVVNAGVTVQKSTTAPLLLIALNSPKGTYNNVFLANYANINLIDQITRVPGISNVQVFGAGQYAMRLWVKPDQLAKLSVTVTDIINALRAQNTVNPAGQIGGEPAPPGQEFTYTVRSPGRLTSSEEFGEIVIRANPDGSLLRLKEVARIELGAQVYSLSGRLDGKPAAVLACYQLPGTNALRSRERREGSDGARLSTLPGRHGLHRRVWIRPAPSPPACTRSSRRSSKRSRSSFSSSSSFSRAGARR